MWEAASPRVLVPVIAASFFFFFLWAAAFDAPWRRLTGA